MIQLNKKNIGVSALLALLLFVCIQTKAEDVENEFQTRTSLKLSFKPLKKVKFNLSPELRFDDSFTLDKSLIEGEIEYKMFKFLSLGAAYRYIANQRENKDTEYSSRFLYSATAQKEINRFETSFRLSYSDYADDDDDDSMDLMRYKIGVEYNIPKCKITPSISTELFQDMSASSVYKMRYTVGADIKLFKKNYIGLSYKLDYYIQEYTNKHILDIGYKIKL
jgi:hypothetical protein